jgi:RNA polymerase sigma-70 factor (ECF subfamily)
MGAAPSVQALAAAGRAAWPALHLAEADFARLLEAHLATAPDPESAKSKLRPDDFYLACACAEGEAAAIRAFEDRFARVIDRAVSRFARTNEKRDELRQILRERLFVAGPGERPKIASYTGQGFLENWLRVAAVRAFVNAERRIRPDEPGEEESFAGMPAEQDVELGFLKSHYRGAFRRAFATALQSLAAADRLVLRLSVRDGLSCDEVAASLGVHRATAARRTARARQLLIDATRAELAQSLRVDTTELTSILQLVESNLDLSISRLFAQTATSVAGNNGSAP